MLAHLANRGERTYDKPTAVNEETPIPGSRVMTLRFDGSCRPNPGPMGIGYLLLTDGSTSLVRVGAFIGEGTNNEAEYQALLAGMRHALKLGFWNLEVVSDSKLVVQQMKGEWAVRGNLARLHREATNLGRLFFNFDIRHVYRESNTLADDLSRKIMFEEPTLPPIPESQTSRKTKLLHDWQAAAIRVWWLKHHPGAGTLSRIFGTETNTIEQIGYGKTYRDATFADYDRVQSLIREQV